MIFLEQCFSFCLCIVSDNCLSLWNVRTYPVVSAERYMSFA